MVCYSKQEGCFPKYSVGGQGAKTIDQGNQSKRCGPRQKGKLRPRRSCDGKREGIGVLSREILRIEQRWKQVCGSSKAQNESSQDAPLPAWQYYSPIARSLVALGGKASLGDLEAEFLRQMEPHFHVSDRSQMANGRERWQVMIRRARKHMFREGWLSSGSGKYGKSHPLVDVSRKRRTRKTPDGFGLNGIENPPRRSASVTTPRLTPCNPYR